MNIAGVEILDKSLLIMDEVDGMSAGDCGGVRALNTLIKKTKVRFHCVVQLLRPLNHIIDPYYMHSE